MTKVVTVLLVALVTFGVPVTAQAHAQKAGPCTGWHHHRGGDKKDATALIRCVQSRWSVSGGTSKAIAVARCESGLREHAYYASGCGGAGCAGFFQQSYRYWYGRARHYLRPRWFGGREHFPPGPLRGRANVIVSLRMVHNEGNWSDWACA